MSIEFTIPKSTGTYADTLNCVGRAALLEELGFSKVSIRDAGSQFELKTSDIGIPEILHTPSAGYPYIWVRSKEAKPLNLSVVIDYEGERDKRDAYRAWQESSKKVRGKVKSALDAQGLQEPEPPYRRFTLTAILASMRKGWVGDLDLAKWISEHPDECLKWVKNQLKISDDLPSKVPEISNSQILNPVSGKGIHAAKTEAKSAGSLPRQLIDPFDEWMKIRGLWESMLAFRNKDDFKLYVMEPNEIGIAELNRLREELDRYNLWGGIKLDIEATLRCAQILIKHSEIYASGRSQYTFLRNKSPRDVVSGLRLAYFMSLGTAAALMNDSFLPLPAWFRIGNKEDATAYMRIIDEAIGERTEGARTAGCLSSLNENNSDDGAILQQFRDWLLTGDLWQLLNFHARFALHVMHRLGAKEWVRPFSTDNLNLLLTKGFDMSFSTSEIVNNPGFLSVARAVRNSTIYAASPNGRREIRFGLAQKWKQKLKSGKADLISAIAEFVQDHNWESINKLGGKAHVVKKEDLDDVFGMIDRHGPDLMGSLLLAYGYSRAPKVAIGEEAAAEKNLEGPQEGVEN